MTFASIASTNSAANLRDSLTLENKTRASNSLKKHARAICAHEWLSIKSISKLHPANTHSLDSLEAVFLED